MNTAPEGDAITTPQGPSRVIHVRNVGPDITQHDLLLLASGFGPVEQVVMLKTKNQALLQFQDIQSAINFMQFYSSVQANVRGRNIYPQFSSHQGLTSTSGVLVHGGGANNNGGMATTGSATVTSTGPSSSATPSSNNPNRILLVTIVNAIYPITCDILHQVFSSHGTVEKIVIFNKTKGLQALIQYSQVQSAQSAKETLHSQNIYTNGTCQLHIQFSNLTTELTVSNNSERTKDFTKLLPTLQGPLPTSSSDPSAVPPSQQRVIMPPHHTHSHSAHPNNAAVQHQHQHQQATTYTIQTAGGMGLGMGMGAVQPGVGEFYGQPPMHGAHQYGAIATSQVLPVGFVSQAPVGAQYNSVLLVSNFPEDKISCLGLFNLFSNYGNVLRVKLLHNKPDHALVQMGDYFQASTAMHYLKGLSLWGKQIDINFSKHAFITAANDPNDPTSQDFSNSPLNRFKFNQGTEKAQQIYKHMSGPGALLHVSNIPEAATAQTITDLFEPFGTIQGMKVFDYNSKKQALIQYASVDHACEALITLHNHDIDGRGLKVSFSKNKI